MRDPWVNVVIPVYNCAPYLAQAIQSVLTQTYPAVKIIVVDDSSTDHSGQVAQSFEPVQYHCQAHAGAGAARNCGVQLSKCDYIAFLDGDDIWHPDKLSIQMERMILHPEIQYSLTHFSCFLEPGCEIPYGFRKEMLHQNTPGYITGTLLVRRKAFFHVGEFNPAFYPGEDVDWFCRAKDKGILEDIIPEPLLKKRVHGTNIMNNIDKNNQNLLWVLRQSVSRKQQNNTSLSTFSLKEL